MIREAKFTKGSTMRHLLVMTGTMSISGLAMFSVDLADLFFLGLLEDIEITDAVSFAATILYFTASVSIGLMIAAGALVARAIGQGQPRRAKRLAINAYVYSTALISVTALIMWIYIPEILTLLGATGRTHALAADYLRIVMASMPIVAAAMVSGGLLRGIGDVRRSVKVVLIASVVNAVLDPILIFGLDLDIYGAAIATVTGRVVMFVVSFYYITRVHQLILPFRVRSFMPSIKPISEIAIPAIFTNIATPLGFAYMTFVMGGFGTGAITGLGITQRLTPVVFAAVFALSASIGPILSQNLGAGLYPRLRQSLADSMKFLIIYVGVAALVLYFAQGIIISAWSATGVTADLVVLFCTWLAITFFFSGILFVANAGFNNLGKPTYSTWFNFGRATLGTIPFVYYGAKWYGAEGVLIGHALGGIIFGTLAYLMIYRHLRHIEKHGVGNIKGAQPEGSGVKQSS